MEPTRRTRAAHHLVTAAGPLLLVAGLLLAGWFTIWAIYAWAARDAAWIASYAALTILALALPMAFLAAHDRWQRTHGRPAPVPGRATRALDLAGGLFATLFVLLALAFVLLSGYFAWMFGSDGLLAASAYFACVGLAMLGEPVVFLFFYGRWRTRNGLDNPQVSA